jgi:hypothetical protein
MWLRSKCGFDLTYAGSFIIHYVERIVYIELSRTLVLFLTVLLCGFNAWFYLRKRKKFSSATNTNAPALSPPGRGKG